ncbi:MAG: aminoglycoside phosphotransferase family protein, partial [Solirubrobacteraceae bacterium]
MDALLLPEGLTRFTLQRLGTAGQAWLDELPTLVDFFCATWQVTVTGRPWSNSNVGLVLPVGRRDGTRAVLKLSPHDDGTVAEARGLAFWDGRGAVRLLDCDLDTVALLMERAVPGTTLRELADDAEAIALAADCLWELWRPMAKGGDFSTAAAVAPRWAAQCRAWYEQLGRPLEPRLLDEALDALAQLPPSAPEAVLCHQDAHQE